jgi:hypothetical protein
MDKELQIVESALRLSGMRWQIGKITEARYREFPVTRESLERFKRLREQSGCVVSGHPRFDNSVGFFFECATFLVVNDYCGVDLFGDDLRSYYEEQEHVRRRGSGPVHDRTGLVTFHEWMLRKALSHG